MDYNKIRRQERRRNLNHLNIMIIAAAVVLATGIILFGIRVHSRVEQAQTDIADAAAVEQTDSPQQEAEDDLSAEETQAAELPTQAPATDAPETTLVPVSTQRRGTMESIPEDIRSYMNGKSMKTNSNISFDDLCYLTIPHYDFNGNIVQGHMVVNAALGEEVLDIFAELFDIKYPIERMELVDKYGADDYTSIEANNTSAFNYRVSTDGSSRLSKHALGCAIDINPQINPYVSSNGKGSHDNAEEYWSRDYQNWSSPVARDAYIGPEAEIYRIFVNEHGWEWGGSWSSYRDYQHFQKSV